MFVVQDEHDVFLLHQKHRRSSSAPLFSGGNDGEVDKALCQFGLHNDVKYVTGRSLYQLHKRMSPGHLVEALISLDLSLNDITAYNGPLPWWSMKTDKNEWSSGDDNDGIAVSGGSSSDNNDSSAEIVLSNTTKQKEQMLIANWNASRLTRSAFQQGN